MAKTKKILYYTVEFDFQNNGECDEKNGNKTITVYSIVNNKPKIFCEIESFNELSSENEIQTYLDNNGYENEEFEFEILQL